MSAAEREGRKSGEAGARSGARSSYAIGLEAWKLAARQRSFGAAGSKSLLRATLARSAVASPLPTAQRIQLERHLGAPLDRLRVHQDAAAAEAARQLGAVAFTIGRDVYLGARASASDLPLMAHEALHALQSGMADAAVVVMSRL